MTNDYDRLEIFGLTHPESGRISNEFTDPSASGAIYEFYGWRINPTIDDETGDLMLFVNRMDGFEVEVDTGRELSTIRESGVCLAAVNPGP